MSTQYQDFKLNPLTGDLDLSGSSLNIIDKNTESLQQRLLLRFSIWEGNWLYDTDFGFPYRTYIGNKVLKGIIDAKIKETVRKENDVLAIENFTSSLTNSSRSYSAYFDVITEELESISFAFLSDDQYAYPIGTGGPGRICDESGLVELANKLYYLINFRMPSYGDSTWVNNWE